MVEGIADTMARNEPPQNDRIEEENQADLDAA